MRIVTRGTLKEFWMKYPSSEKPLRNRYEIVEKYDFSNPNEIIRLFKDSDIIGNGRIIFNICHNRYRLIAKFEYQKQLVFVRFIGTHDEYDKLENIEFI